MIKLLQKYNRWILVIFGGLLMVAFLLPQTLQMIGTDPATETAFVVDGRKVTVRERNDASAKMEAVARYEPTLGFAKGGEQWLLLNELATRAGVRGNRADGIAMIPELAQSMVTNQLQALFQQDQQRAMELFSKREEFAKASELELQNKANNRLVQSGEATTADALADARGVTRLLTGYLSAPRLSEARAIAAIRKATDEATISYIVVSASEGSIAAAGDVTDAQLTEHFDKYKGLSAGTGEFGIGYLNPDRAAVQYAVIDRNQVAAKVTIDAIAVEKRLLELAKDDKTPVETKRAQVQQALRDERVTSLFAEAVSAMKGELLRAAAALPDRDGYKVLPTDTAALATLSDLKAAATRAMEKVKRSTGVDIAITVMGDPAKLLTIAEVSQLPGVGQAVSRKGTVAVPVVEAIFLSRELRPESLKDRARLATQLNVPVADSFEDAARSAYFVVIRQASRSGPPATLDEIRAQATTDVRKIRAFEAMKTQAESWAISAGVLGLADLSGSISSGGYTVAPIKVDVRISRGGGARPAEAGVTEKTLVEAVMSKAEQLDATKPLELADAIAKSVGVAAPAKLSVVIAEITQFSPLTIEQLRGNQTQLSRLATESFTDTRKAFEQFVSSEALIKRLSVTGLGNGKATE